MTCIKCNADLPPGSLFCNICGAKQNQSKKRTTAHRSRPNGAGSAYKRDKTWVAEITLGFDSTGKRIKKRKYGFKTKKDALDYITTLRTVRERKKTTLADIYATYSTSAMLKLSKSKQTHYKTAYTRIKDIAYIDINTLGITALQDVVNNNTETFYPAKDIKDLLSILYTRAMAEQLVTVNLSRYIVLPDKNEKETIPFTENEIRSLWEDYAAGELSTGYFLIMIYTGMMPGEMLQLTCDKIYLADREIVGAGIKTTARKNTPISIAEAIVPIFETLIPLASSVTGRFYPHDEKIFYDCFKKMVQRTGGNPELRPYSCRHTAGTELALANIAPSVIQLTMRHAKLSTTTRYIHIHSEQTRAAVNALDFSKKSAENG